MRKSQFNQFYSLIFVSLLIACFGFFYATIHLWGEKNLAMQDFSDLKTSIYNIQSGSAEKVVSFNERVNISVVDNFLFFNSSGFGFSQNISNTNPVFLENVMSVRVHEAGGVVVLE